MNNGNDKPDLIQAEIAILWLDSVGRHLDKSTFISSFFPFFLMRKRLRENKEAGI